MHRVPCRPATGTELETGFTSMMRLDAFKRLVPRAVRRATREAWRAGRWRAAMHALLALGPGAVPGRRLLQSLREAWGNDGFSADVAFLEALVAQAATTPGPVLECGSGLTTVLLGALAGTRGVEVWTLEHEPGWFARTETVLWRHHVPGVRFCLAPLRDYGAFTWYDPPLEELPEAFSLVVCDGPPAVTPGGRYGLMPLLGGSLAPGAVVLLDDAARPSEAAVVEQWSRERALRVQQFDPSEGAFAVITVGA
jgi:predicted O-methyltransferase YrrM